MMKTIYVKLLSPD